MKASARLLIPALMGLLLAPATLASRTAEADLAALDAVTRELCPREIAMLGESSTHGDGHTEAFKVALVQRLVTQCGFDSVFFEANHVEFIQLDRRLQTGQPISADEVSAAIGGLWKFDQEFQPLIPFLLAKAQSGQISLGGVDDQLGQLGQDYANVEMVAELTGLLPEQRKKHCALDLHRRIYSDFTETAPYTEADRSQITTCLTDVRLALAAEKVADHAVREDRDEMVAATQRWIDRDFTSREGQIAARDHSMFQNFEWLRRRQPRRHKVILWTATVHLSKQADPAWLSPPGANFGSYVHQQYGARAFSLGFSSLAGSYRQGRRDLHAQPQAPPDSLEAKAFREKESDTVYLGPTRIDAMGTAPAATFQHVYESLPWGKFLDGMVVFREETPPTSTR